VKNIFLRLLIVWLMLGQGFVIYWLPRHYHEPSKLESDFVHDRSSQHAGALASELNRAIEFESRRGVALTATFLAVDLVIIFFCWNIGRPKEAGAVSR
jgi:hypothetical protein